MKNIIRLISAGVFIYLLVFGSSCKKADTCSQPAGLAIVASSTTSATAELKWTATPGTSYQLQIRPVNTTVWVQYICTTSDTVIRGLSAATTYQWQVTNTCGSTTTGAVSGPQFTTLTAGCPAGYEGSNCNTMVNTKFIGSYTVNDSAVITTTGNQVFVYAMHIAANGSDPSSIILTDFGGFSSSFGARATVQGSTFTVADTTIPAGNISITHGQGSISGNTITFTYSATDATSVSVDRAVGTK